MKPFLIPLFLFSGWLLVTAFCPVQGESAGAGQNPTEPGLNLPGKAPDTITFIAASVEVQPGGEVCIPVSARNFDRILSMQFSVNWDPDVISLKDIRNYALAGLSERNFGFHLLDKGLLTFSWYDAQLSGVTENDDFQLYELCFIANGKPGDETKIEFTSTPTVIEVANADSEFLRVHPHAGRVYIDYGP